MYGQIELFSRPDALKKTKTSDGLFSIFENNGDTRVGFNQTV